MQVEHDREWAKMGISPRKNRTGRRGEENQNKIRKT